ARHDGAAVQHAVAVGELLAHHQLSHHPVGRRVGDLHAEPAPERGLRLREVVLVHGANPQCHCERSEAISTMRSCASEGRLLRFARNDANIAEEARPWPRLFIFYAKTAAYFGCGTMRR